MMRVWLKPVALLREIVWDESHAVSDKMRVQAQLFFQGVEHFFRGAQVILDFREVVDGGNLHLVKHAFHFVVGIVEDILIVDAGEDGHARPCEQEDQDGYQGHHQQH